MKEEGGRRVRRIKMGEDENQEKGRRKEWKDMESKNQRG